MDDISPREREVLELVADDLGNAEIARRLFISVRTVESHVSSLLRKLDATDRAALADLARVPVAEEAGGLVGAPQPFTSFVGRSAAADDLAAALAASRLVSLVGPGGMGKTRLAVEVGGRLPVPRAWFVDLVPARPGLVTAAVAAAIGATDHPGQSLLDVVCEQLGSAPTLVVLDNCEHVLDDAAEVAERIVTGAPGAIVLATSREPLAVPGERVVQLGPLASDGADAAAVQLLVERARDAGADVGPDDGEQLIGICTALDGLPLAIELAAARCASLGVDGVAAELTSRLRLLDGARRGDPRHRSLRAVIDWSHELLDDDERALLRRVAVFHGSFDAADATAVAGDGASGGLTDLLARLVAKSLVVRRSTSGRSRFRLLDTVRAYGLEQLEAAGEVQATAERHHRWAAATATRLDAEAWAAGELDEDAFDVVVDDLREALRWGVEQVPRDRSRSLARSLARLAYARRFFDEARQRFDEAAAFADDDGDAADDLLDAGHAAFALLRGPEGFARFVAAGERAERAGRWQVAATAYALAGGRIRRFPAEFGDALPTTQVAVDLLARAADLDLGTDLAVVAARSSAAAWLSDDVMWAPGNPCATLPAAESAVAAARAASDAVYESDALDAYTTALWEEGRFVEAADVCTGRLSLLERMSPLDPRAGAEQLDILHMACDGPLALGDVARALDLARRGSRHVLAGGALHVLQRELVVSLCLTGDFDLAIEHADVMRSAWERMGEPAAGWMSPATYLTALVHGLRGDADGHRSWLAMSDTISQSPTNEIMTYVGIRLALHEGRLDDATAELARRGDDPSLTGYGGYLWVTAAEVVAAAGAADAEDWIDRVRTTCGEHMWAAPTLERAEARLTSDPDGFRRAAAGFEALGAAFEAAVSLALLPGEEGDVGRARLRALGCTPPV